MFFTRRLCSALSLKSATQSAPSSALKISPAALWHAHLLGIQVENVKGTGPKGHILKSDILNFSKNIQTSTSPKTNGETCLLMKIPKDSNEFIIKKCLETVNKLGKIDYKLIPEIGLLQVKFKHSSQEDVDKLKNLLKIYLNDFRHLLL